MANKVPFQDESLSFISSIMNKAVSDRATDIHWEPFVAEDKTEIVVRFRVDGILRDVERVVREKTNLDSLVNAIKIMGGLDPTKRRREQDGRFSFLSASGDNIDIRLATMPTLLGEKAVMRIMDRSRYCLSLEDLGMTQEFVKSFQALYSRPEGFLVVAGPTGSGKTTTLYSVIQQAYSRQKNVCTIEDPVECKFVGINQIQVDHDFGMSFVTGLRAIMRQDSDIIAVGEIRDGETARISLQAAMAGSMVFTTFHGRDTVHSIIRLMDMGVEPYFISSALSGVVAQRLIRLICRICKGKGCSQCVNTGYKKRAGIFELLPINDAMRDLILKKSSYDELRSAASGLIPFQVSLDKLLSEGLTDEKEIRRVFAANE